MKLQLSRLKKDLEKELNNTNVDIKRLIEVFCNINDLIAKIYLNKEIEKIDYDTKYKEILERSDREELLNLIFKDLIEKFSIKHMNNIGLIVIVNSIYDFCCLTVYQISEDEIIHLIIRKQWNFYSLISMQEINNSFMFDEKYSIIIKELHDKYIKILESHSIL